LKKNLAVGTSFASALHYPHKPYL